LRVFLVIPIWSDHIKRLDDKRFEHKGQKQGYGTYLYVELLKNAKIAVYKQASGNNFYWNWTRPTAIKIVDNFDKNATCGRCFSSNLKHIIKRNCW
jgi:hypothetical protein